MITNKDTFKEGDLVRLKSDANAVRNLKTKIFTVVEQYYIHDYKQTKVTDSCDTWVFFSDELEHVVTDESIRESANRILEDEAVRDLLQIDSLVREKAKKYELIAETFFMACGMIEDGDSIKYIVDPDTVCDAILNIIVNDVNIDKERIVKKKRKAIDRDLSW